MSHWSTGSAFEQAEWGTSNFMADPHVVMETDSHTPAGKPYAGVRTSLAFRSSGAELPEHMHAFVARDYSELDTVEQMRQRSVELNKRDDMKAAKEIELFEAEIERRTEMTRSRLDFYNTSRRI
jgi:hypothetical protein